MTSSLQSLLGAEAAAAFATHHWPRDPFVAHRTLEALPEPLRSQLLLEPRRLTQIYRGPVEITNGPSAQIPVSGPDASVYFERLGLAVRLSGLEDYLAGSVPWLRTLERELGVPEGAAGLHAFINAEGIGLPPHCDPGEHIAIQLAGTKEFRYRANPHTGFMSASHSCGLEPSRHALSQSANGIPGWATLPEDATTVTLRPGSVLFLPRGVYHETRGGSGGASVTLVIQLRVPSHADLLLGYLRHYLVQSDAWRAPAAGAWPDEHPRQERVDAQLQRLLRDLAETIGGLSTEHMRRSAEGGAAAQAFAWGARLQRNPAMPVQVCTDDESVVIAVNQPGGATRRITLQRGAAPVFEWVLAQTGHFDFEELAHRFDDWDASSLIAMVRFLVVHRAVLVLPIEPYRQ